MTADDIREYYNQYHGAGPDSSDHEAGSETAERLITNWDESEYLLVETIPRDLIEEYGAERLYDILIDSGEARTIFGKDIANLVVIIDEYAEQADHENVGRASVQETVSKQVLALCQFARDKGYGIRLYD
ncbi:hypothetical protein HUG10_15540 [Halorarum halophilum]|uniref:Uncharacterized protein n=1 Tax=Halorarum halophilum TaxID=2743090 RepID=A0A7D5GDA2_9EURY|nr:hypothetical protein [Halobaculum halophilum]QLG28866.1 hypothetical protein HUG10_15540 [Halobaculum halophilum]